MAGEAETVLKTVQYHGEKRQRTFEKYALMHLHQHLILEALMAHGYVGIDPGSKVCFLLAGIRCSTLDAVKTRIISDEGLRADFVRCITLFKDFVKQTAQTTNVELGIAVMSVNDGGGGKSKGKDCWYTLDEWRALPKDKQATIRKTRADRKKKSGGKKTPKGGPMMIRKFGLVQKLKKKVQNQKCQLAAMHAAAKSATNDVGGEAMESDSSSDDDQRKHSVLTCQGTIPCKASCKGGASKS
jgi:hypothetical protein